VLIILFVFASAAVITMGELSRRHSARLREEQAQLEGRVRERTAELNAANDSLRELSGGLLQLQDDERRRIARELHDSVGQLLVGISMNLSRVRVDIEQLSRATTLLSDSSNVLVEEVSKEVRTISHLLHPPLLDEAGLSSALRWYADGFARRSGICRTTMFAGPRPDVGRDRNRYFPRRAGMLDEYSSTFRKFRSKGPCSPIQKANCRRDGGPRQEHTA
jgi:signal transduction histidine kinase